MASNLPPGVTEGMLPGNRPEDWGWDALLDDISSDADQLMLDVEETRMVWEMGKKAFQAMRESNYALIPEDDLNKLRDDLKYWTDRYILNIGEQE